MRPVLTGGLWASKSDLPRAEAGRAPPITSAARVSGPLQRPTLKTRTSLMRRAAAVQLRSPRALAGYKPSFATRTNTRARSDCEWQICGDESEFYFGSTRPAEDLG